jgi:hypothetical protein
MKVVLILSGGLDSSVLLARLLADRHEVHALSVDYGQRHRRELEAAREVAAHYGVDHRVADLSGLRPLLAGSSQTDASVPVPHGHYAEESMKATVVPNRNMLLLGAPAPGRLAPGPHPPAVHRADQGRHRPARQGPGRADRQNLELLRGRRDPLRCVRHLLGKA